MNCPSCSAQVNESELVTNVRTWEQFCLRCASRVCPSFLPYYILTTDDCAFLRACGIDPEVAGIEDALRQSACITPIQLSSPQTKADHPR
jgi:hypothetical protein